MITRVTLPVGVTVVLWQLAATDLRCCSAQRSHGQPHLIVITDCSHLRCLLHAVDLPRWLLLHVTGYPRYSRLALVTQPSFPTRPVAVYRAGWLDRFTLLVVATRTHDLLTILVIPRSATLRFAGCRAF